LTENSIQAANPIPVTQLQITTEGVALILNFVLASGGWQVLCRYFEWNRYAGLGHFTIIWAGPGMAAKTFGLRVWQFLHPAIWQVIRARPSGAFASPLQQHRAEQSILGQTELLLANVKDQCFATKL